MPQIIVSLVISALMVLGSVAYNSEQTKAVGASQSISSLTELTSLSHNDVFPITEVNGLTTKKVKWGTATSSLKVINDALYSPLIGSASLTTLGTITTGTWNADTLTVSKGGTGSTSLIAYQLLAGNGTGAVTTFGNGTLGYVLTSNGAGALPSFQNVGVTLNNNNTWTGTNTFSATTTFSAQTQFNATSTFSSSTVGASNEIYGNGIDGDVIISANATNTTDKYYNNLTINSGISLDTGGYKIFVKGTFTNNGTLSHNGQSASGATVGSGATSGTLRGGAIGGAASPGTNGARGGAGGGGGGLLVLSAKNIVNNGSITANGGAGGNGNGDGDAGGASSGGSAGASVDNGRGGAGGGSGTSANTSSAAGGTVTASKQYLAIPSIAFSSGYDPILDKALGGGAGGGGGGEGNGVGEAGGGGGGGGVVVIFYSTATFTTETATGGIGGTKTGNGTNGTAGSDGLVLKIQI